ncbi:unnamed protein product [Microthlaspi erraticum]|uniref:Uncharacterized protein n=1 Tax=Microthlaspi erraticum TaxID=1685480 RepID=A0A6D2INN4_9BRAS|nr:unnamed protein product [Microthlaspi erraticum]
MANLLETRPHRKKEMQRRTATGDTKPVAGLNLRDTTEKDPRLGQANATTNLLIYDKPYKAEERNDADINQHNKYGGKKKEMQEEHHQGEKSQRRQDLARTHWGEHWTSRGPQAPTRYQPWRRLWQTFRRSRSDT